MTFRFSERSLANLEGVHPLLVTVVNRALQISAVDFMVIEGVRSDEQCRINYGKGRNAIQCVIAGIPARYAQPKLAKVTWLKNPYASRHRKQPDGYGHAVDLLPAPYDWGGIKPFDQLADAMFRAAKELGVPIRWGWDWNQNHHPREKGETDGPHFELIGK